MVRPERIYEQYGQHNPNECQYNHDRSVQRHGDVSRRLHQFSVNNGNNWYALSTNFRQLVY